jgi:acyl-CoA reductase-like NAD-dependent aldehyde dehydrogenase
MAVNDNLEQIRASMQSTHDTGVNLTYAWRRKQLDLLQRLLTENKEALLAALYKDLGKEPNEAMMSEYGLIQGELNYAVQHLRSWMKPQTLASPGCAVPAWSWIEPRPLQAPATLIMGPFNYPLLLCLYPLIGSLAAGNPTVLKPSELTPNVSALLATLVEMYFEKKSVAVVLGGPEETQELLKYSWGLVFFTGSSRVGTLVAQAAAKTLTPAVLELGGKSPCFVDVTAPKDMQTVANRVSWAKWLNAGQTCAAVDYCLVHSAVVTSFIKAMLKTLEMQYGKNPKTSELGRMVTSAHAERQIELIREIEKAASKPGSITRILLGSSTECDSVARYICPFIVLNPPRSSRIMTEEIFGPILPILTVESRVQVYDFIKSIPGTPLCKYAFTSSKQVFEEFNNKIQSGSTCWNEALFHMSSSTIPFGGLGSSGYGRYFGKHSFETFSHAHPVMYRPCFPGSDFNMLRFHPLKGFKGWLIVNVVLKLPLVPNLHLRKILLAAGVTLFLKYGYNPAVVNEACSLLADGMEGAADWLRS